jgi:phosphomannomutase
LGTVTPVATNEELRERVDRWIATDPDPESRDEMRALLESGARDELRARFAHGLSFGTAGLRGRLGAGPSRMNVATVRSASAGLAAYLGQHVEGARSSGVVIGHDARHGSARFASEAAAVFSGAGLRTLRLPPLVPTPVLAFAVRRLGCAAGVMITASHNPPQDNGYKVFLGDGAQISSPVDERIAAEIERAPAPNELPLGDGGELIDVADDYLDAIVSALPRSRARALDVVYTPLHGVGGPYLERAFALAGFARPRLVSAQAEPDPDFPTVERPNPEEPGTLDLALAEAEAADANILLVNDPDADRLAVAVPGAEGWRALSGDQIGALLADFLLASDPDPAGSLVVTTVASSTLLGRMAEAAGARYVETLTGFKWIMRALAENPDSRFLFGYEEALGYAVSEVVRDKDGISAALVLAQLAAEEKSRGRTLRDRLADIAARFGFYATGQLTLELEGADGPRRMSELTARLRADPPDELIGRQVTSVDDVAEGVSRFPHDGREEPLALPRSDVLVLRAEDVRVVVRPSGTEPKLKTYLEVVAPDEDEAAAALAELRSQLAALVRA